MGNLCSTLNVDSPRGRGPEPGLLFNDAPLGRGLAGHTHHGLAAHHVGPGLAANTTSGPLPDSAALYAGYTVPGHAHRPAVLTVPETLRAPPGPQAAGTPTTTTTTTTTSNTAATGESEAGARPSGGQAQMPPTAPVVVEQQTATVAEQQFEQDDYVATDYGGEVAPAPQAAFPLNWTKGKLIGAGAFGQVFVGLNNNTGEILAVKQVALTKDAALKGRMAEHIKALEAEVAVLRQLRHPNIVQYLGTERTADTLNIFLEYVPGGSIASVIDKFGVLQEPVIRVYAKQILRGLEYLHQKKIMHRDIKGANILVDKEGTVKLADFGASKKIENLATVGSGSKSIRGTPYWMAPEVIKQTGHGRPADIWSLACVVIEMATGKPPWSKYNSQVAAMFHIASTKEPPELPAHLSNEAKDFLLLCFNRIPKERPHASRLLCHPWMANTVLPASASMSTSMMASHHRLSVASQGAQQPVQQHTRLVPPLPLGTTRSPPSPIKEEPETARDTARSTPNGGSMSTAASNATSVAQLQIGPLEQGRRASLAPPHGLPPLAPAQTAARQSTASMPAAATSGMQPSAPERLMSPLGEPPQEQYDTIVSPSAIPPELRARLGMPAAQSTAGPVPPAPAQVPAPQQLQQQAPVLPSVSASIAGMPGMRASVMTLMDYNPMQEPSWMPLAEQFLAEEAEMMMQQAPSAVPAASHANYQLDIIRESADSGKAFADAIKSPRAAGLDSPRWQRDQDQLPLQQHGSGAQDVSGLHDQPQAAAVHAAGKAHILVMDSSMAADDARERLDPVRASKMKQWHDELEVELEKGRRAHKAARASLAVGVQAVV